MLNSNIFDATIPILFGKGPGFYNARKCYNEFFSRGIELSVSPYRLPINKGRLFKDSSAGRIANRMKDAIDSKSIFAGRY
jgi:hypothetical protein